MRNSNGKGIRFVCLSLAVALAASFVLAELPGLYDGPPDMDRKMNFAESGGAGSNAPAEHYIVALDETAAGDPLVQAAVIREVEDFGGTVYRRYSAVLNGGFAATLPTLALEALQSNPYVAFVEPDDVIGLPPRQTTAVNDDAASAGESGSADSSSAAPMSWGIDRIDQRYLPLDNQAIFDSTGAGSNVYVLDTGIRYTHSAFGGRASSFYDYSGGSGEDCNGHGTHSAGLIHAIAPDANIWSVRVLNCMGSATWSNIIAGMDYLVVHAEENGIVSMGLGGNRSLAVDTAVDNLVNAKLIPVVAAGNENQDACNVSPAAAPNAITVGATDNTDHRSSYSNWGECLDIFAPGTDITSTWYTSDTATRTISGTSMAVPHVAGAIAHMLNLPCGDLAARCIESALIANSTPGIVHNIMPGSPNAFLYAD